MTAAFTPVTMATLHRIQHSTNFLRKGCKEPACSWGGLEESFLLKTRKYRISVLALQTVRAHKDNSGIAPKASYITDVPETEDDQQDGTLASRRDRQLEASSSSPSSSLPSLPSRLWKDMTTVDFSVFNPSNIIAVLPVAAIEQHGPHLPLSTDATINEGILKRAMELVGPDFPVSVLPAMPVGKSNEHVTFPGTLSLTASTLTSLWTEIGNSVARAGVKKLVIFNSHGGQPQIVDIVARELRVRHGMLVVGVSWFSFGVPDGLFPKHELEHGIHGGSVETSVMLHLRPDLVRTSELRCFRSLSEDLVEEGYKLLQPEGPIGFGWQMQDLHEAGVCGNALDADARRGQLVVEHTASKFVELLEEVRRFPIERLKMATGSSSNARFE